MKRAGAPWPSTPMHRYPTATDVSPDCLISNTWMNPNYSSECWLQVADQDQSYCAGWLEGVLLQPQVYQSQVNFLSELVNSSVPPDVMDFVILNLQWTRQSMLERNISVYTIMHQLRHTAFRYQHVCPSHFICLSFLQGLFNRCLSFRRQAKGRTEGQAIPGRLDLLANNW